MPNIAVSLIREVVSAQQSDMDQQVLFIRKLRNLLCGKDDRTPRPCRKTMMSAPTVCLDQHDTCDRQVFAAFITLFLECLPGLCEPAFGLCIVGQMGNAGPIEQPAGQFPLRQPAQPFDKRCAAARGYQRISALKQEVAGR
ncbi:hypothetical protein QEO92_29310 (plasmid) [Neorhizobium petrolearium]|uniref:Uncharacterized protein n=1 Tax=Neorhizobium petrolearium TaxID=515361 RepID=A0ABY8MA66_9HYPH|nr:hypothetical protein [Neorhizobium petrolearium]WGI71438.1 hypothetical protein QEO92_29310 [Neorhizobium petrolearium]